MHADSSSPATVRVRGVSKRFGATEALSDVDIDVRPGAVHALLGGNGSGKSTLVKVLAGVQRADAGTIERFGELHPAPAFTPATAHGLGLRFVHQALAVFPSLSIAENLALGTGYPTGRMHRIRWSEVRTTAAELVDRFEIAAHPETLVGQLRPASQALVAVARALADETAEAEGRSHVLVVDEATAALPREESERLIVSLRSLARSGRAVLFISHRVDEVLEVADEITVLQDGVVAHRRPRAGLSRAALVELLAGGPIESRTSSAVVPQVGAARLRIADLVAGPLRGIDLAVAAGEVVGVGGLRGSGRSTLIESVFDAGRRRQGRVEVDGVPVGGGPRQAMAAGIALVPESRAQQALFGTRTVSDNLTEATVPRYYRRGWLSERRAHQAARLMIDRHAIVAPSERAPIGALSGGNQQKVVLARWMARTPTVLLLDDPTRGVDVGARAAIHALVADAVAAGACALVASSDTDELITVCDRIVVLVAGKVVAERRRPFDRHELFALEQSEPVAPPAANGRGAPLTSTVPRQEPESEA
jgi:ribose transport system ATP-binding protein